jgi:hypothetical protein
MVVEESEISKYKPEFFVNLISLSLEAIAAITFCTLMIYHLFFG